MMGILTRMVNHILPRIFPTASKINNSPQQLQEVVATMRRDWNQRAVEDASFYVAFYQRGQPEEAFRESAQEVVQELIPEIGRLSQELPEGTVSLRSSGGMLCQVSASRSSLSSGLDGSESEQLAEERRGDHALQVVRDDARPDGGEDVADAGEQGRLDRFGDRAGPLVVDSHDLLAVGDDARFRAGRPGGVADHRGGVDAL